MKRHVLSFLLLLLFCSICVALSAEIAWAQNESLTDRAAGALVDGVNTGTGAQKTTWIYITETKGITTVWRLALGLVDVVIVGALLLAAFANIFRFKIDTYGVKQALPGIIIGIILAHLSYFIMRLFIEGSSVLTQGIGVFVSQYFGADHPIGALPAGHYLVNVTREELFKSVFTKLPEGWGSIQLAGITAVTLAVFTGSLPGAGVVGILFLILFAFIPLILFLILLFLLYLRSYILVMLFMVSPLAFFSLGFPALKSYWQKWWGTFWKWLIMLPASIAVLSFAPIFLYFVNKGITETFVPKRTVVDYFFINGVAIAILFLANRIPFMWGSFFGFNAMKEWSKFGAKQSKNVYRGSKWTGDKIAERYAEYKTRRYNPKNASYLETLSGSAGGQKKLVDAATKLGVAVDPSRMNDQRYRLALSKAINDEYRRKAATDPAWQAQAAKDLFDAKRNARNRNIFRLPQSAMAGAKERLSSLDKIEEKSIKQHSGYAWWGGPMVQFSSNFGRFDDTYKEMQDERLIMADIKKYIEMYRNHGGDPTGFRKFSDISSESGLSKAIATDPVLLKMMKDENLKPADIIEFQRGAYYLSRRGRPGDYANKEYVDATTGVTVTLPPKLTRPELTAQWFEHPEILAYADVSGASFVEAEQTPDINTIRQRTIQSNVAAAAQGQLSPEQREHVLNASQEHVAQASSIITETGSALEAKLKEVAGTELPPEFAQNIMRTIFNNLYEGILNVRMDTFSGLTQDQFQQILPFVQSYSQSIKGLTNITDILAANDRIGIEGEHAKAIAKLKLDINLDQARQDLDEALTKLNTPDFSREDSDRVISTYVNLAPHLRFDKTKGLEDLRKDLMERGRDLRGMLNVLNYEEVQRAQRGYNPSDPNSLPVLQKTIQSAIRVEQLKKETLTHAANEMEKSLSEALKQQDTRQPVEIVTDQKVVEKIRPQVEQILEFHPDLRARAQSLDAGTKSQVADSITREMVQHIAQSTAEGDRHTTVVTRENAQMRDWLHRALQEGFAKMAPPTGGNQ